MDRVPAARGTADYRNRGRISKLDDQQGVVEAPRSSVKAERKPAKKSSARKSKPIKPDLRPPEPHRMGKVAWKNEQRKLDALFAIYVMGWETKQSDLTNWRHYIKPSDGGGWESDMLPYFHDDTRFCYHGVEALRKEGLYLTVETRADGYEVVEKTKNHSVRDKDLNFAIMAVCLLLKGVGNKDIQHAWNNQDDWSKKAAKRHKEQGNGSA